MSNSDFAIAGLWRRFAAVVYDFLLVVAVSLLYFAIATGINVLINGAPEKGQRLDWGYFKFVVFLGWVISVLYFFCYFWCKSGQTLGMKTWHLKILNQDNQYPGHQQALLRCLIAPFSLALFGIGYWWMFIDNNHQTLHEKLSKTKTIVIKDN